MKVPYKDENGNLRLETLRADRDGEYFKISHVPFWASNIAVGDVLTAELDEGELYFGGHISFAENSTIHVVFLNEANIEEAKGFLSKIGCSVCKLLGYPYLAVNVLKDVDYSKVREYLKAQEDEGKSSFKESCLSDKHRRDIS